MTTTTKTYMDRTVRDLRNLRATFDITLTEAIALCVLLDEPKLTMSGLADAIEMSRAAVTTLADRLELAGLAERQMPALGEGDRRQTYITIPLKMRQRILGVLGTSASELAS